MVSLKDHADGAMRGLLGHGLVELFLSLKIWRSVLPELAQGPPLCGSPHGHRKSRRTWKGLAGGTCLSFQKSSLLKDGWETGFS